MILLPFYIIRYENVVSDMDKNPEKLERLLNEYEDIRVKLEKELSASGKSELYMNLNKLIVRIADYIFRNNEKIRKGVGEVMGGKVLQLESERLRAEGEAIGRSRGKIEGEAIGRSRGKIEGEAIGRSRGKIEGEERMSTLINRLILDGRTDEIQKVVTDQYRRKELYREYGL